MKKQRSRVIDMRYHWTVDRVAQQQFDIIWEPGVTNLADYYTKHRRYGNAPLLCYISLRCPTGNLYCFLHPRQW